MQGIIKSFPFYSVNSCYRIQIVYQDSTIAWWALSKTLYFLQGMYIHRVGSSKLSTTWTVSVKSCFPATIKFDNICHHPVTQCESIWLYRIVQCKGPEGIETQRVTNEGSVSKHLSDLSNVTSANSDTTRTWTLMSWLQPASNCIIFLH